MPTRRTETDRRSRSLPDNPRLRNGEKIVYTDRFDDPNLPGEMRTTVTLNAVSAGTELTIVQEGIPEAIPPDMCYLGWQDSLEQLANLVNPEIPD